MKEPNLAYFKNDCEHQLYKKLYDILFILFLFEIFFLIISSMVTAYFKVTGLNGFFKYSAR